MMCKLRPLPQSTTSRGEEQAIAPVVTNTTSMRRASVSSDAAEEPPVPGQQTQARSRKASWLRAANFAQPSESRALDSNRSTSGKDASKSPTRARARLPSDCRASLPQTSNSSSPHIMCERSSERTPSTKTRRAQSSSSKSAWIAAETSGPVAAGLDGESTGEYSRASRSVKRHASWRRVGAATSPSKDDALSAKAVPNRLGLRAVADCA
mmetsp:Transcript_120871/g.240789  ORF Transcript_120871/g.240789 Transcript_120871/m.240789 type:complete len:210 (-) Transcript_120871:355-984(-)